MCPIFWNFHFGQLRVFFWQFFLQIWSLLFQNSLGGSPQEFWNPWKRGLFFKVGPYMHKIGDKLGHLLYREPPAMAVHIQYIWGDSYVHRSDMHWGGVPDATFYPSNPRLYTMTNLLMSNVTKNRCWALFLLANERGFQCTKEYVMLMLYVSPSVEKLNWLKIEFGVAFLDCSEIKSYCFTAFDNDYF
jgi:hypothetical protein